MIDMEDIYSLLVAGITKLNLAYGEEMQPQVRDGLHELLDQAEVMHLYIGFREENKGRMSRGLEPLQVEGEFYGDMARRIRALMEREE